MKNKKHHIGESSLKKLPIGLVSQFPLEPMHLVYLGVVRKLVWLWLKSPRSLNCKIGTGACEEISKNLKIYSKFLPKEFNRKGRSLVEFERWKAAEFRTFLLYTGIVATKRALLVQFYKNFLYLFIGTYYLEHPRLLRSHCDYANELLRLFVSDFGKLYDKITLVYNIHNLIHLAADAQKFGPLQSVSAFAFESYLGNIKRLLRSPNRPLPQIIRRMSEMSSCSNVCANEKGLKLFDNSYHFEGPMLHNYRCYRQIRQIKFYGLIFSIVPGDNCVKIGNVVGLIRNIVVKNDDVKLFFESFRKRKKFFEDPLESSYLGIFMSLLYLVIYKTFL